MTLKDIASIAGKPGLYKILKPTRNGMIVASFDDKPKKFMVNAQQRVSVLKEISMYTTGAEDAAPLLEVLLKIKAQYGEQPLSVDVKDDAALLAFLAEILPEFDRDRVYASDVKKLVQWYNLLIEKAPEVIQPEEEDAKADEAEETKEGKADEQEVKAGADSGEGTENSDNKDASGASAE